jgi:hypothetical protein
MARTRRVAPERESTPAAPDLAAEAAKVFAATTQAFARAPAGQSFHVAIVHLGGEGGASAIDASAATLVCAEKPEGERTVVVAPLDDPRFCRKCLAGRPSAAGSGIRVVAVLVSV